MLSKIGESPAGKAGLIVIVVLAIAGAIFAGIKSTTGNGEVHADGQEVKKDAQKQADAIQNNPNIPPALKAEMMRHYQGEAGGQSSQSSHSASPGVPTSH